MAGMGADGCSQAGRRWPALDPASAPVDGRSALDLLAFVQALSRELVYTDDSGRAAGDWRALLPEPALLLEALTALADPARLPAERAAVYARPHVALLLAFIDLLDLARDQLNDFGRRHLEHHYRQVLQMVRKPAVPDQVHLLAQVDARSASALLPAGSLFNAGQDKLGRDRLYRSPQALVLHPVRVAALKSLRADIRQTGLREASLQFHIGGSRSDAFVAMLRIALGRPEPGGALATPIWAGVAGAAAIPAPAGTAIAFEHLLAAHDRLRRVGAELFMPLFDSYRSLIALRARRKALEPAQWVRINRLIEAAGQARAAPKPFTLKPLRVDDFVANLCQALGLTLAQYGHYYDGLPEVKSAEQAYAVLSDQATVRSFVTDRLFMPLPAFRELMGLKADIDADWSQIIASVEAALRLKLGNPDARLPEAQRALRDVDALLAAALGFKPAEGLDGFQAGFAAIEAWFNLSAEQIDYLLNLGRRAALGDVAPGDWDQAYGLCSSAHENQVYRLRRGRLSDAAAAGIAANDAPAALAAMLLTVLGQSLGLRDAIAALSGLRLNAADAQYIGAIAASPAPAAASLDWARIATALELAQRNREAFVLPLAEQRVWRHLYAAADASQVLAKADPGQSAPRWKTFGSAAAASDPASSPPALIGWAVASPLLALAEGRRTLTLRLGCLAEGFDPAVLRQLLAPDLPDSVSHASVNPFLVQLSGAQAWVDAACDISWSGPDMGGYPAVAGVATAITAALRQLVLTLTLDAKAPAIVPARQALHGLDADTPLLRVMLRPSWRASEQAWVSAYPELQRIRLARLSLAVAVNGLSSLMLRNDIAVLDAHKPFEPFGVQPAAGARLRIGHPELVAKSLDALTLRFTWLGAPASLKDQYLNYKGALDASSFNARVGFKDGSLFAPATAAMAFFDADSGAEVVRGIALPADPGSAATARIAGKDVADWSRCLVWELAGDFQHSVYPALALQTAMAMASFLAAGGKPSPTQFLLCPPYTPKLKSLSLDYRASVELAVADLSAAPASAGLGLIHLHPFGSAPAAAELEPDADGQPPAHPESLPLLPQYPGEGALYIGLAGVQAPLTLSLLLQVAEGSADPDLPPGPLRWACLDGDRWVDLQDGALLEDGSRGLINSGIARLALRPVAPSRRLPGAGQAPGGLYWLRLAMDRATAGACDMVAIHPNALLASGVALDGADQHLASPLPPGSISALRQPLAGVAKLLQPYSSFGGKPAEASADFNLRVSERLRHKQRALSPWDYERLVLEHFPQLHQVRCLRPGPQALPGQVELIVVPDISHNFPLDPFEPKAPADLLREIERFLADKTPAFASLRVRNAFFVPLKVRCGVRFAAGQDLGFARQRLNDELNRFLSPWAYDEGADLTLGGAIYANSIIDFIDERDYVDYVAELRLFMTLDGKDTLVPEAPDYHASVDRPDAVLVAALQHEFDVIASADYRVEGFAGINYMKIELDFIVS